MKKIILILFTITVVLTSCKNDPKEKTAVPTIKKEQIDVKGKVIFNIDANKSILNWKGFKPMSSHNGTIDFKRGKIILENNRLVAGKFEIDMNSIINLDIPTTDENNAKLIGHLRSPDFFDVESYPITRFKITKAEEAGEKIKITGLLFLKGKVKSISLLAKQTMNNGVVTIVSDVFEIDRTDFGIQYKSKKFFDNLKDKFISDRIAFSFTVVAEK